MTTNELIALLFPVLGGAVAVGAAFFGAKFIAPKSEEPATDRPGQAMNIGGETTLDEVMASLRSQQAFIIASEPDQEIAVDILGGKEPVKVGELLSRMERARSHFRDMESAAHSAAEELDHFQRRVKIGGAA